MDTFAWQFNLLCKSVYFHILNILVTKPNIYFIYFLQQTGASQEIPHYVIAKATYMQEVNAACAQLSQCATRTFPLQQLRRNPGTATAASSCSDAATHTKEILIAPRDGNLRIPGWENGGVCMKCLETNAGKCCASAPLRWWGDPRPLCHREMSFPIKLHGWKAGIQAEETQNWGCLCLSGGQRLFLGCTGVSTGAE